MSAEEISERRIVGFQEKYYTQIWPFISECGMVPIILDLTPYAQKADFIVYPVWDDVSALEDRFSLEFVKSVFLDDVEVYRIYQKAD
jgi:hypothetical protein